MNPSPAITQSIATLVRLQDVYARCIPELETIESGTRRSVRRFECATRMSARYERASFALLRDEAQQRARDIAKTLATYREEAEANAARIERLASTFLASRAPQVWS